MTPGTSGTCSAKALKALVELLQRHGTIYRDSGRTGTVAHMRGHGRVIFDSPCARGLSEVPEVPESRYAAGAGILCHFGKGPLWLELGRAPSRARARLGISRNTACMHTHPSPRAFRPRRISFTAVAAALLTACAAASTPTPSEVNAIGRGALATLAALCARLPPAGTDPDLQSACAALAKADGIATEVCPLPPELLNPWPEGGAGGK